MVGIKADEGPTIFAGIGLGVKSSVSGIIVFRLAGITHLKMSHGGLGAVIGDVIDDGVTRAAVGAVNKWIQIASILGIKKLVQTVFTDRNVR